MPAPIKRGPLRRLEAARQRFALTARRRQAGRGHLVAAARRIEKDEQLVGAPAHGVPVAVAALVVQFRRVQFVALGGAHPALVRKYHRDGVVGDQVLLAVGGGLIHRGERRAARIPVRLGVGEQFFPDQGLQPCPRAENRFALLLFGFVARFSRRLFSPLPGGPAAAGGDREWQLPEARRVRSAASVRPWVCPPHGRCE